MILLEPKILRLVPSFFNFGHCWERGLDLGLTMSDLFFQTCFIWIGKAFWTDRMTFNCSQLKTFKLHNPF